MKTASSSVIIDMIWSGGITMAKKQWIVKQETTLLAFLLQYSGISKKQLKYALGKGWIVVNDQPVRQANWLLKKEDVIHLLEIQESGTTLPFEILYEDEDLLAINKPAGLLSISAGLEKEQTAYHLVRNYLREQDPRDLVFVVHRLDRDTSGVLLFAKNEKMKVMLQSDWNHLVKKRGYLALAEGRISPQKGTLKNYLAESRTQQVYVTHDQTGKLAITHYHVMRYVGNDSLLEIDLDTGRKNQIRVQLAHIGHPLCGDRKYNPHVRGSRRLCLHAHCLELQDPRTKSLLSIQAPKPDFCLKIEKNQ